MLFPLTLNEFEKLFNSAPHRLELQHLRVTPHCMRHGGPSEDYAQGLRTLADIQKRGRWMSTCSVRRYEKSARLLSQLGKIPPAQLKLSKRLQSTIWADLTP